MKFQPGTTIEIIERTPAVLHSLLTGISGEWIYTNEGNHSWSVFDVVGHLIVCEKTDFITRTEIILSGSVNKIFAPIDMHAQFEWNKGKTIQDLLIEFEQARHVNLEKLQGYQLQETDLEKTGVHPRIGTLKLKELLATWAAHDLNHIAQIARIMAFQYKDAIGPFIEFIGILK